MPTKEQMDRLVDLVRRNNMTTSEQLIEKAVVNLFNEIRNPFQFMGTDDKVREAIKCIIEAAVMESKKEILEILKKEI